MAADVSLLNGVLTIQGDSQNDWIEVENVYKNYDFYIGGGGYDVKHKGAHFLRIKLGHLDRGTGKVIDTTLDNIGTKEVDKIVFYGGAGNDYFFNNTAIVSSQYGESGYDHLHGGSGPDYLDGGWHSDYLYGKKGDDILVGGWGDDQLQGGDDDDTLTGNWGNDNLRGGNGSDEISEFVFGDAQLTNDLLNSQIYSWSSTDTVDSVESAKLIGSWLDNTLDASGFTAGGVTLDGRSGNDTLLGTPHADQLTGGPGADKILAGLGKDRLYEQVAGEVTLSDKSLIVVQNNNTAKDTLDSIHYATLRGSEGPDQIDVSQFTPGGVTIWAGAGDDSLLGSHNDDLFYGQAGNDVLNGAMGDDVLYGLDGDDVFMGKQGDDTFYGGNGFDRIFETIPGTVLIADQSLTITPASSANGETFVEAILSIEQVSLAGNSENDFFDATNFSGKVEFYGLGGSDTLFGGAGDDLIFAGNGNDTVKGGQGDDGLFGGMGNDTIVADVSGIVSLKDDKMTQLTLLGEVLELDHVGSFEKAKLSGSPFDDIISTQAFSGESHIFGLAGNDFLVGNSEKNILSGGSGNDHLQGNGGLDTFFGGIGDDTVRQSVVGDVLLADHSLRVTAPSSTGGAVVDNMLSEIERVEVIGSSHDETLDARGFSGSVLLDGKGGNDVLFGTHGNDVLRGSEGDDRLYSGDGADTLFGGPGNDTLISIDQDTADVLFGGSGTDSFWVDQELLSGGGLDLLSVAEDTVKDANDFEKKRNLHLVDEFENGADKSLDGDDIADPSDGKNYKDFSHVPLFGNSGPSLDDVQQGKKGDCWLLAGLGAAAKVNPNSILQTVVDLGDGTYAVELGDNFYRVDAELPTLSPTDHTPKFARLGRHGDRLWVPIVEKAYAYHHLAYLKNTTIPWSAKQHHRYQTLNGGWPSWAFNALGHKGMVKKSFKNSISALNHIQSELAKGKAVVLCTAKAASNSLVVKKHCYVVQQVNYQMVLDASGNVTQQPVSVLLYNPWGIDGGAGADGASLDGQVTITGTELVKSMFQNGKGIQSAWLL